MLASQVKCNANVIMISETKLDDAFPVDQFVLECFSKPFLEGVSKPFKVDHNKNGGCILFFVREDIQARLISTEKVLIKSFFIELNLRKKEMDCKLFLQSYNLHKKICPHIWKSSDELWIFIPLIMIVLFFLGISMQM